MQGVYSSGTRFIRATKEATDEDSNELHKIPFIEITIAIHNTAEL